MTVDSNTALAIVSILAGLASSAVVVINAVTRAKLQILAAGQAREAAYTEKLEAIEQKVNGSATAAANKIDSLHTQVAEAKQMIADLHQTAAVQAVRDGN